MIVLRALLKYVLIVLSVFQLNAQDIVVVNSNASFICRSEQPNADGIVNIRLYSSHQACKYQKITIHDKQLSVIDKLVLSDNGALLLVEGNTFKYVYNLRNGDLISKYPADKIIGLGKNNNRYIVSGEKYLTLYNVYGQEVRDHKAPVKGGISEITYLPGDKGFYVKTINNHYYLFRKDKGSYARRTYASQHVINPFSKTITLCNQQGGSPVITQVEMPSMRKIKTILGSRMLKVYEREVNKDRERTDKLKYRFLKHQIFPSTEGRYISYITQTKDQNWHILVQETSTEKINLDLIIENQENTPGLSWLNDSMFVFYDDPMKRTMVIVPDKRLAPGFNYYPKLKDDDKRISEKRFSKKAQVSPNQRYAIYQTKIKGDPALVMTTGAITQNRILAQNVEFIGYDESSRIALVKREDRVGIIRLSDIEMTLDEDNIALQFLSDTCNFDPEDILGEAEAPMAYSYPRFERQHHISTMHDTTEVNLVLQTITHHDSTVNIDFQILDNTGNYYWGASAEQFKQIWCNTALQFGNDLPEQLQSFTISEMNEDIPLKLAISVVLDHSGSMGMDRILALEQGLKKFFDAKAHEDGISIVKYDFDADAQGPLSTDPDKLKSNLDRRSYDRYGGGTALLDGVKLGIEEVQEEAEFNERIVIVITDGNENSSKINKNRVILDALEQGVKIYTIGFGDFVSDFYLKSIAYNTKGNYYRIYESNELGWIYNDIYQKIKHYYRITFTTKKKGTHKLMMQICPEKGKSNPALAYFDNYELDLSKIDPDSDQGFDLPFDNISRDSVEHIFNNIEPRTNFEGITSTPIDIRNPVANEYISEEQKAFDKLVLPKFEFVFDETTITNDPKKEISMVLAFMTKYPETIIEVVGHTDNEGKSDYNQLLSENRAMKVVELLVAKGAQSDRLIPIGKGDTEPLDSNDSESGRQHNRRVEFILVD